MGDWSYLSSLLDKVQSYSTPIGKIWMSVLFIFRILVLGAAADAVWGDEQDLLCNTMEPGCDIACYDWMFPISHIRFWVLQILFITTPTLVYLAHAVHVIHREKKLRGQLQEQTGGLGLNRLKYTNDRGKVTIRGVLLRSYMAQLFARIALEVAFIVGQYYLYGFIMVREFDCMQNPCPGKGGVECYMSRPTEKTIFIIFMLVVACVSVLLNIIEVFYLICSCVKRGAEKKALSQINSAEYPASLIGPAWKMDMNKHLEMTSMQHLGDSCAEEEKMKHT